MLKSQQSVPQQQSFIAQKMILNPLELLVYELQSKQLQSRKQSIETVDVIALAMDERQIVEELIPLLMKNLVEESNKEVKIAIVKSFRKLIGLLSRQRSFLKMLEITIDIAMVFDQPQIKSQAIQVLNSLLFYQEQQQPPQQSLLQFPKVYPHFKHLFSQLTAISSTQPITSQKVAIQLSMYLIRYVFKHQQKITNKQELKQLIDWLKKHFFEGKERDFLGLKSISETFQMVVEYWPQVYIQELRRLMDFVYEEEKQDEKNIQEATQSQTVNSQITTQTKQITQKDPEITQTLLPNSPKLSNLCSKQLLSQIKSNLIPTIIQLSKRLTRQQAFAILSPLLSTEDPKIKLSLVKKTKQLFESFKQQDLIKLLNLYKSFSQQQQQVKKAIVQYIDVIPFQSEQQKNTIIIKYCKNTIQLKNILINALIKSSQKQKLGQVLSQSDYDVKTKTWIKLPDLILHQQHSYADILNSLLSQTKKNFRSKLNIVTNLITRMEDNARVLSAKKIQMASVFNIAYFLPILVNFFDDRIALIRVNVAKLSALILYHYNLKDEKTLDVFKKKFYAQDSSWVERQNVLIMIKEYLQLTRQNLIDSHHNLSSYIKHKNEPLHALTTQITKDSINGIPITCQSTQSQPQKLSIKNISLLAQQIRATYSI